MIRRFFLACLLLLPLAVRAATAVTPGAWTAAGPDGGTVLALAVDPANAETLYASTEGGGIFWSFDAGESWSALGLSDRTVTALALDPWNNDVIYAGTTQGLYQSLDRGETWVRQLLGPVGAGTVLQILIDPLRPADVYVLFRGGAGTDVVRSLDRGVSWESARRGLPADVTALAIDPKHTDTLYAGTESHGVYSTYDRGGHWRRRKGGNPPAGVTALAVDTVKPSWLYAGTLSGGVYLSLDGGATWKKAPSSPPSAWIRVLVAQPGALGVVWAGTTSYPGASRAGVFRTTNGGKTWAPVGGGLVAPSLQALVLAPGPSLAVYAGVQTRGVYRWTEDDPSWKLANHGLRPVATTRVAADPAHAGHVLVGTLGFGVLATADGGDTWRPVDSRPAFFDVLDLEYDPTSPAHVYAVGASVADRSLDGGSTWQPMDFRGALVANVLAVDPSHAAEVYAATKTTGIFHSSDFGSIWLPASSDTLGCFVAAALRVAPGTGTVYAGGHAFVSPNCSASALYRSTDDGATWQALTGYGREQVYALAIEPDTGTVFAGFEGVLRSTDGGDTWTATGIGDGSTPVIYTLLAAPGVVYAGGVGNVWESRDDGLSWQEAGTGLADQTVLDLSLDPEGVLWAATTRGVFRLQP